MEFLGYTREDGTVGTRNYIGIIPSLEAACDPAILIANGLRNCVVFTYKSASYGLIPPDEETVYRALTNLGKNPNLAGVLVIGPGECSDSQPDRIANGIANCGKPVDIVDIHKEGGVVAGVSKGLRIAGQMASDSARFKRDPVPVSELRLGIRCGGSTPISGIVTNAAMGAALDLLIENNGSGCFTETPEVIGAEHIIADRAINDKVKNKMLKVVRDYEKRLAAHGIDYYGANPNKSNIDLGLSSIEEKSLGAIRKSGTKPLNEVVVYGDIPKGKGLFFVDCSSHRQHGTTAMVMAGCNIIIYSTESAALYGFPSVPVIKMTANAEHFQKYNDILDYLVDIDSAVDNIRSVGQDLLNFIVEVASGTTTQSELFSYVCQTDIWTVNPV